MTTTVDDQKKNAANVLEVFGSFRVCFQQWSNLVSVRRRTIAWNYDFDKNGRPPDILPDLGLRDRLASLGAKLLPNLNGLTGEPAISQPALAEIMSICESARDNTLLISPQPGKYLGPTFDVLEADLRSLSGSSKTTIAGQVEWSAPMTGAEFARRVTGQDKARKRDVTKLLERFGFEPYEGKRLRVRLDTMDANTRKKVEHPEFLSAKFDHLRHH